MCVAAAAAGNEAAWVGGNHKYEYFTVPRIRHVATSPLLLMCVIIIVTIIWHVSHHLIQLHTPQEVMSAAFSHKLNKSNDNQFI